MFGFAGDQWSPLRLGVGYNHARRDRRPRRSESDCFSLAHRRMKVIFVFSGRRGRRPLPSMMLTKQIQSFKAFEDPQETFLEKFLVRVWAAPAKNMVWAEPTKTAWSRAHKKCIVLDFFISWWYNGLRCDKSPPARIAGERIRYENSNWNRCWRKYNENSRS